MVQMSARERAARRSGRPPSAGLEANVVYVDETAAEKAEGPGIGHNAPVAHASLDLTPEQWIEWMATVFAEPLARKDELLPSFKRFEAGFMLKRGGAGEPPIGIEKWNDEIQGRAGDLRDKLRALVKRAGLLHALEKQPILAASSAVDGYKNTFLAELGDWDKKGKLIVGSPKPLNTIQDRMDIFGLWKESEGRRVAQEEAQRAQDEAARLAAEAKQSMEPEAWQAASEGYSEAAAAQAVADAKPADLSRVKGPMGSTSSLRSNWTFEVSDLMQLVQAVAAGKVPLSYLQVNEVRVRVAIRSEGMRKVDGLRIFDDLKVR